jgi:hypothetical protein
MAHPYKVLIVVRSESNPDKTYEIRTSHQDGKTYCTCPGWIFKARKGDGICKHIAAYRRSNPENQVVIMTSDDFENFRRAIPQLAIKRVKNTDVKRTYGEGL